MSPVIVRKEAEQLWALISQTEVVHFLVGAAGGGKTAVVHQAVAGLMADGVPTLVLRLDRYGELASTADLVGCQNSATAPDQRFQAAAS
jgi:hypothetical protein